jgi:pimeloyl-ACP methyl ester carboxylesterase
MIGGIAQRNVLDETYQTLPPLKRFSAHLEERLLCSDPFIFLALPIAKRIRHGVAVAGMLCSGAAFHLRQAGYDNDWAQFATIANYPLERITAPTLVVHGPRDQDVPFADAQLLMERVLNVTLVTHERGDHAMFYTHAHTVMPMVRDFILHEQSAHEQSAAELAVPHKKRIEA